MMSKKAERRSTSCSSARQSRRQIEAKPVNVHFEHPIAQRIHDQLQHVGMAHVETVAGSGVIHIVPAIVRHQAVIGGIVDPFKR